ncbi:MAG: hypothetical protein GFGODING_00427 [Flavobacteriales bacterium]|nr:hypothetical protein [Flavobacteriales bacterium]
MATFYILYSATLDRYYVGHTAGPLEERLRRHMSGHRGWTGKAKDWRVVHREEFADKGSAYAREREVKSWKSRSRVEVLVSGARQRIPPEAGGSLVRIQSPRQNGGRPTWGGLCVCGTYIPKPTL